MKKALYGLVALLFFGTAAHVHAQTCGVSQPWALPDEGDAFVRQQQGCDQSFIDDIWKRFDMAKASGDDAWSWFTDSDACNYNLPFGRTINALQMLAFGGTGHPHCDYQNDLVLNWAFCYSGNAIHYLAPHCDAKPGRVATTYYGTLETDPRTDLHKTFFYDQAIYKRAAAVFHEARHADGWCTHVDCPSGAKDACDPSWDGGCTGFSSSSGIGAYAYTVSWLSHYAVNADPNMTNADLRSGAIMAAIEVLDEHFVTKPCFKISITDGSADRSGC